MVPPYGVVIQEAVASGDLERMKTVAREVETYLQEVGNVPAAFEQLKLEIAKLQRKPYSAK